MYPCITVSCRDLHVMDLGAASAAKGSLDLLYDYSRMIFGPRVSN